MIFLQAPDADRIGLKPVNERCAKVQARPGNRTELAETRHHRALVLPNREKRRHQINEKQQGNERDQADHAEEAAPGTTRAGQLGYRKLRRACPSLQERGPMRPASGAGPQATRGDGIGINR